MSNTLLSLENLTKSYGSLMAVKNLSLEIREGEIYGLLGPNGAGKTTCISMICGLLKPDSGRVVLRGNPVDIDNPGVIARIGVCPQSNVLWPKLTCLEQLTFIGEMYALPSSVARKRGEELLEVIGLSEKRNTIAASLSGGMQRRLNLIIALVHDPELLILDEPETGLDPQSRVMVREFIRDWARGKDRTVILTTHNMDEADRMSDRIAIIDHGELLVEDTPESLKRSLGEGDVVEIDMQKSDGAVMADGLKAVEEWIPGVTLVANTLVIRGNNLIAVLPRLTDSVRKVGLQVGEVRLRENSLEDVFISLTGRRLRE